MRCTTYLKTAVLALVSSQALGLKVNGVGTVRVRSNDAEWLKGVSVNGDNECSVEDECIVGSGLGKCTVMVDPAKTIPLGSTDAGYHAEFLFNSTTVSQGGASQYPTPVSDIVIAGHSHMSHWNLCWKADIDHGGLREKGVEHFCYDVNGLCFLWASPCSGGCSKLNDLSSYSSFCPGLRYATSEEFASALPALNAGRDDFYKKCAASRLDPRWNHCDYGNNYGRVEDNSWNDLVLVCDASATPSATSSREQVQEERQRQQEREAEEARQRQEEVRRREEQSRREEEEARERRAQEERRRQQEREAQEERQRQEEARRQEEQSRREEEEARERRAEEERRRQQEREAEEERQRQEEARRREEQSRREEEEARERRAQEERQRQQEREAEEERQRQEEARRQEEQSRREEEEARERRAQAVADAAKAGAGDRGSAVGDPHLQNVFGQRFDLLKEGKHVLIAIPRGMSAENALLRVEADARQLGGQCEDMYFQELNVTGSWAEGKQAGGYRYSASKNVGENPEWTVFGNVELKVVHGRTKAGLLYLNLYVKHLKHSGFAVGGLLGEDDHSWASQPSASCHQTMALLTAGTSSDNF